MRSLATYSLLSWSPVRASLVRDLAKDRPRWCCCLVVVMLVFDFGVQSCETLLTRPGSRVQEVERNARFARASESCGCDSQKSKMVMMCGLSPWCGELHLVEERLTPTFSHRRKLRRIHITLLVERRCTFRMITSGRRRTVKSERSHTSADVGEWSERTNNLAIMTTSMP
jgi:hypothetical protein